MEFLIVIGSVLVIYYLILIPVQYRNIAATRESLKKSHLTHNEMYEKMSFEEQQLQFNLQGNLFNLPATLIAQLIYYIRHRDDK
ncbi:DUF3949 domain-containing protein [Lederbergia citrea]|uniref:DUF3949 domain-containing protein n=1 Tax=Lederbergia citrea TaxID=2833581 RepID=A0A942UPJ5_9BACI|nr:DUF3949 domain-containing protein [Lederbergia citrea]MBS4179402.1 DUF3949 domain-containing protein [Lederbergia citrea]MBS4206071.1 DUF3949 domain-containing protein [Lederbergia citrea]MBS4224480.1 DUF3949 domain-containing protein [Lederbergia citrea]